MKRWMIGFTFVAFTVSVAFADSGGFHLLSAQFENFNNNEFATTNPPLGSPPGSGGSVFYTKAVYVPEAQNALIINVSMTGDETSTPPSGNQLLLSCLVDGNACNPGSTLGVGPTYGNGTPGWIALQNLNSPDDQSDNGINYSWCAKIPSTGGDALHPESVLHTVKLKLASGDGSTIVFVEGVHVFVYSANLSSANRCTLGSP
jgi:hypothetical protein